LTGASLARSLLLALCLGGCAINPTRDINAFAERSANNSFELLDRGVAASALVLPVVQDRQYSGPTCGAHALASVINYWAGAGAVSGNQIYATSPPADANGYSMQELIGLAQSHGLLASGVRLGRSDIIRELDSGRPVLIPVRIPSIYVQQRTLPGTNTPVIGLAENAFIQRAGQASELMRLGLVNHYVLVVGYDADRFVILEPVMGYRTISFRRLARYRGSFHNAAIVFSATTAPAASARRAATSN
jgi:predicted double-glycine peptidase